MKKTKKKAKKKTLSTFMDKPLASISSHVGKLIDRSTVPELVDLFANLFCAYGGYEAARKLGGSIQANLGVAGSGVLAYQLAKQPNLIAGASGVGYLASLGLINVWNPLTMGFFKGALSISEVRREGLEPYEEVIVETTSQVDILQWFMGGWQSILGTGMPPLATP